jgi:hypothetical protein
LDLAGTEDKKALNFFNTQAGKRKKIADDIRQDNIQIKDLEEIAKQLGQDGDGDGDGDSDDKKKKDPNAKILVANGDDEDYMKEVNKTILGAGEADKAAEAAEAEILARKKRLETSELDPAIANIAKRLKKEMTASKDPKGKAKAKEDAAELLQELDDVKAAAEKQRP